MSIPCITAERLNVIKVNSVYLLDYLDVEYSLVLTYANQLTILRGDLYPFSS